MRQSIVDLRELADTRSLFAVVMARGVSSVGDWLYLAALPILLYQATGDVALVGLIAAGRLLPWLLLSIPAGIVADRVASRSVLVATELVRAALMLFMGVLTFIDAPLAPILVCAVAAAVASTFSMPAFGRFVPEIAGDDEDLGRANVVGGGLDSLACIIGPGIAALLLAAGGLELAFFVNGVSFLGLVIVLLRLKASGLRIAPRPPEIAAPAPSPTAHPGWATLIPAVVRPLAIDAAVSFAAGLLMVLPVLVISSLGSDATLAGALSLAAGVGGVVGAIAAASFVNGRLRRGLAAALGFGAVGLVVVALGLSPITLSIGVLMAGAAVVALDTLNLTQVQRTLDARVLGRGLGLINTSAAIWVIVGSLVPTLLAGALGLSGVVLASTVVIVVLGGLGLCPMPRRSRFAASASPTPDGLATLA